MRARGRRRRRPAADAGAPRRRRRARALSTSALEELLHRIHRQGPISFADFMEAALYGEGGFYTAGGGPGRRRDFLTSPEVGPLFGAVVARALDAWWEELGRPDPYVVVDAGAGPGALARGVAAAAPRCAPALHYVLAERSDAMREAHARAVPLEPPSWALGGEALGRGPLFASLGELPAEPFVGVVLANELLDNLPVQLLERSVDGWSEVRVAADGERLTEVLVPAPPDVRAEAERLAPAADRGARIPLAHRSVEWLRHALAMVERGRVVVVDYASPTPEMASRPWRTWFRSYRSHGPGTDPLDEPGSQDLTCEVPVDQLAAVRHAGSDRVQADFLAAHGINHLVDQAKRDWESRAAVGDLDAVRARSRMGEAAALTDASGLGAFRVLEWAVL